MILLNSLIRVKELTDDLKVDGIIQRYDDTNPYMFVKVIEASEFANNILNTYGNVSEIILVLKRVSKVPFIDSYLVSYDDVMAVLTPEEYEKLKG